MPSIHPIQVSSQEEIDTFVEDTITRHDEEMRATGGLAGELDAERQRRISSCFYSAFVYPQQFEDIFIQIATVGEHLAKDHPFYDGNKRTSVRVIGYFLKKQGISLTFEDTPTAEDNELYQIIQKVVTGQISAEELAQLLRDNSHYE